MSIVSCRSPDCRASSRRPLSRWLQLTLFAVIGPALLATGQAQGADRFEPAQRISQAIEHYLGERYTLNDNTRFRADRIDPRLRLHLCDEPLSVHSNSAPSSGRVTVQVACHGNSPWHIYVPVRIEQFVRVLSLVRPLAPGSRITADDLGWSKVDANRQNRDYLTDPKQVIGHVIQHPAQAGHIISSQDLGIAQIIKRGDHVAIRAGDNGFSVTMSGIATSSAGLGQRVDVKNSRTGTIVQGTVISRDTVQVID